MVRGERFNAITHIIGTILALVGTTVAVTLASLRGGATKITVVAVYGAMLIVLYLSSTLYHSLPAGKAKRVFHVFDHCAIYLLIAGTYTPLTLWTLRGAWGWWLFGIVWTLAVAGVLKDTLLHGRMRAISMVLYVLMGWLCIAAYGPIRAALPSPGVALLIAGGIAYTAGILFFALSKRVAYGHGIWHLFVIAGSICHYVAVLRYVAMA